MLVNGFSAKEFEQFKLCSLTQIHLKKAGKLYVWEHTQETTFDVFIFNVLVGCP